MCVMILDSHFFEVFFVEVSHGPFHPSPEQHAEEDNYKLSKLGKDSLGRNKGYLSDISNSVLLIYLLIIVNL